MADEVVGLMENLKFSEEKLVDVCNDGEEMSATMEGSEKWVVEVKGQMSQQVDKGKMFGHAASRLRSVKRTLKGKNEVCNPIAAKKSKTMSNLAGDEDEISEATSPIKLTASTVEVGTQPLREP
ncbi:hypothetical protein V6N13_116636 [Hibiscus sabdariffa]